MNKNIKKLLESLFDDDFNDIYVDDSDTQEVSQMIQDDAKITSLAQCDNIEEVNEYFINKYNLVDNVLNTITDIMSALKKTNFPYAIDCDQFNNEQLKITVETDYSSNTFGKYFKCVIGDKFIFNIKQIPYEITYRNKPKEFNAWCVSFPHTTNNIVLCICNVPNKDAVNKFIESYNKTHFDINEQQKQIGEALMKSVEQVFNTQRIADELTCTGKVYKVVQKDIDRMNKCIDTRNFSGFDKITKADKMVARLAALFICAKNRNIKDLQLQFNDDILLSIILGHGVYSKSFSGYSGRYGYSRSRINMSSKEDYINILRKLQKFPTIHLKDVIATYNAYKDQF